MKGDDVSGSPDNEDTEDNAAADVAGLPTTGQVIAYLERNLDFLAENPDLLRRLTPPDGTKMTRWSTCNGSWWTGCRRSSTK